MLAGEKALPRKHDTERLCAIHSHMLGKVYDWAGQIRTTTLAKRDFDDPAGVATRFTDPEQIKPALAGLFSDLRKARNLKGMGRLEFAEAMAHTFNRLNVAHAFPDGNGRTQRTFLQLLAREAGHDLSFRGITSERMSAVSIAGARGDMEPLKEAFDEILDPVRGPVLTGAVTFLARLEGKLGITVADRFVATTIPGREYEGRFVTASPDTFIFYSGKQFHIGNIADLPGKPGDYAFEQRIAPFTAGRTPLQAAHALIDRVERDAPGGRKAAAIADAIAKQSKGPLAAVLQEASGARLKAAQSRDRMAHVAVRLIDR